MPPTEYTNWLKTLKAGDKVAINLANFSSEKPVWLITKVKTITEDHKIRVDDKSKNGLLFNRYGVAQTGQWERRLQEVSPEILEYIEKEKLVKKIRKIELFDLSLEKLDNIVKVVEG